MRHGINYCSGIIAYRWFYSSALAGSGGLSEHSTWSLASEFFFWIKNLYPTKYQNKKFVNKIAFAHPGFPDINEILLCICIKCEIHPYFFFSRTWFWCHYLSQSWFVEHIFQWLVCTMSRIINRCITQLCHPYNKDTSLPLFCELFCQSHVTCYGFGEESNKFHWPLNYDWESWLDGSGQCCSNI